jgi:hypothetical protein
LAAGRKRIWRSLEKIKAEEVARPVVGISNQSAAVLAEGAAVMETCHLPWAAMEALAVMAMKLKEEAVEAPVAEPPEPVLELADWSSVASL